MLRRALSTAAAAVLGLLSSARVSAAPEPSPAHAAAFDKAFTPSFTVETRDEYQGKTRVETVPFKVVEAGSLHLPSGQVCAADPFIALSGARSPGMTACSVANSSAQCRMIPCPPLRSHARRRAQ